MIVCDRFDTQFIPLTCFADAVAAEPKVLVPDSIGRSTPGEVLVSYGRLLISVPYFR